MASPINKQGGNSSRLSQKQSQTLGQNQSQNLGLTQSLTMTPQLVQSIKLLQMSSADLLKHVEEEVEKNPLLEIAEDNPTPGREEIQPSDGASNDTGAVSLELDTSQSALEAKLGTSFENEFDRDLTGRELNKNPNSVMSPPTTDFSIGSPEGNNLEEYVAEKIGLREHLNEQLALSNVSPDTRKAALEIIDLLDEDGFLRQKLHGVAIDLKLSAKDAECALELVQSFDPIGVAARDLSECLMLQLQEKNRFDPAMECLVKNLELLAKRDFDRLVDLCDVSLDDLLDMVDEIKELEPRPTRAFDTTPVQAITPEIFVTEKPDGSFGIELNPDTLPKVLINQSYQAFVATGGEQPDDKAFMTDNLQSANWLIRSLEQRANTILKVMAEIVRRQDGFFAHGISHLRPLSLQQVADEIKMHESTVSRVTSNKYVQTSWGNFELKYFFTASINASDGEDSHSAEVVRQQIKKLIEAEKSENVLSDDAIVAELASDNIEIARRTVAKYRELMGFASSVQRRREKKALASRK